VNSTLVDFIINNEGYYRIISSVRSVNTMNQLHIQDNLLTCQPQLVALYNVLRHTHTIGAVARYSIVNQSAMSPGTTAMQELTRKHVFTLY
jgi:hypothetical protein